MSQKEKHNFLNLFFLKIFNMKKKNNYNYFFQSIDIFLGKLINKLSENNQIIIITNNISETRNINLNNNISIEFGFVRK